MTDTPKTGRWIRLAAGYQMDPRVVRAGPRAELVWIRGLALARQLGTDGHIAHEQSPQVLRGLNQPRLLIPRLVEVGLWEECDDGWRVPYERWARWQTTQAEYSERAEAAARRQREYRERKHQRDANGPK